MPKPRLKPKPDLKPKPTPKPRFVEAGAGEDELFGGAAGAAKNKNITPAVKERVPESGDQDLFDQARKSSFRFVTLIALHLTRIVKKIVNTVCVELSLLLRFPDRAVRIRVLVGIIVLCCGARHHTLTLPLSTEVVNRNRRI